MRLPTQREPAELLRGSLCPMSKKTRGWDQQGSHRTPDFYRQAHAEAQRKSSAHWHGVSRAQAVSGVRDPGVWSATARPPRARAVSSKFEEVRHITRHADKRTRQRKLRPGTCVHTVIDDRTSALITAWPIASRPKKTRPRPARTPREAQARERRLRRGEARLAELIGGAAPR